MPPPRALLPRFATTPFGRWLSRAPLVGPAVNWAAKVYAAQLAGQLKKYGARTPARRGALRKATPAPDAPQD